MATLGNPPGTYPGKYWVFYVSEQIQRSPVLEDEIPAEANKWGYVDFYPGTAPRYTAQVEGFNLSFSESENYRKLCLKVNDILGIEDVTGRTISGIPTSFNRKQTDKGADLYNVQISLIVDYPDPDTLTYT